MKVYNRKTGAEGEALAAKYLKKKGYKIVETNYSCKLGEIDIIAERKSVIVFVEVKTRTSAIFERPCEAVTPFKQMKIRQTAQFYLKEKRKLESDCRFDVIEVLDNEINHIENAF